MNPDFTQALHEAVDEAAAQPQSFAAPTGAGLHLDPTKGKALLSWFLQQLPGLIALLQGGQGQPPAQPNP